MRIHFTIVIVLFCSILAAQPVLKSPQKFSVDLIDGYPLITRSPEGQYRSFDELPKDVREIFLLSSTSQSQSMTSNTKQLNPTITFVVSNASDAEDIDLDDGTYSPATLRSAIQNANKLGGSHAISFSPGITVIQPAAALPSVNVALNIDGTVSAGKIILDGSGSTGTYGLILAGTSVVKNIIFKSWKNVGLGLASGAINSTIQRNEFTLNKIGLNVNAAGTLIGGDIPDVRNFAHGNSQDGIDIVYANDNSIIDNFCGTKDGFTASPNTYSGIYVLGERNIVIKNLISGNNDSGLEIGEYSKKTLVKRNYIGLDNLGIGKLPNMYDGISTFADNDSIIENYISGNGYGITVLGQSSQSYIGNNMIGSNVTLDSLFGNRFGGMQILGTQVVIDNNIISCNKGTGISITGFGGTTVKRNYIGVDPTGMLDWGNTGSGIYIGCDKNIIGGSSDDDMNIISGNGGSGIEMYGGTTISFPGGSSPNYVQGNLIQKNYLGTDITGDMRIPNSTGISMQGNVDSNFVYSNLISGNQHHGVWLKPSPGKPTRNIFSSNYIGTDDDGISALSNDDRGIYLQDGADNIFGGPTEGDRNIISGNDGEGVLISGSSTGNKFIHNFIGTEKTGYFSCSNISDGILINQLASNNVIQWNFISSNGRNGITVETNSNLTPNANIIIGNTIGMRYDYAFSLPNVNNGILIHNARNTRIGGSDFDSSNIISGNQNTGIYIYGNISRGNLIRGNYIGTNSSGENAFPNHIGIVISGSNKNTIGGIEVGAGNLISGNTVEGIYFYNADSNSMLNNVVGLNLQQTKTVPNGASGVVLDSSRNNVIGDDQSGIGNTISGNTLTGIVVSNISTQNSIFNNSIGTDYSGTKNFGNEVDGIQIVYSSYFNRIGKPGDGNTIMYNKYNGVFVADSNRNTISANSMHANKLLGIDLYGAANGVTPNDGLDPDIGGNNLQNFPTLLFADGPFPLRVVGTMVSKPNETYTIEIFSTTIPDSTGYGEGKTYISSQNVGTDSTGFALFNFVFPTSVSSGMFITATATDFDGNTSEFSKCVEVKISDVVADIAVSVTTSADTVKKSDTLAYVITLQNNGPDSAKQIVLRDTLSKQLTFIADSSSKGTALFSNGILTVTVGLLEPGEKVKIVLIAKADSTGLILNKAYASSMTFDFNMSNNHAADTVVVPIVLAVDGTSNEIPKTYSLQQNYPNPFNPTTTIRFDVPVTGLVSLTVYDLLGRNVSTLVNEIKEAGRYSVRFDASRLSTGVYMYTLHSNNYTAAKKLLLIK